MTASDSYPVFDGHNDVLLRLFKKSKNGVERDFLDGDSLGQLDFPRMKKGGFCGGIFAVYIPSGHDLDLTDELMQGESYDVPLSSAIAARDAMPVAMAMASILFRIEKLSNGKFKICRTAQDIRECIATGRIAAVLHLEGAEPIDADLNALEVFYKVGLRSLGPVWSRPTIFGHGVPFRFPSTGDTGPGLTDSGKALVKGCDELGIAIDLSHMTEKGFWDVAAISTRPLIATHSNPHSICPSARNLTDRQLDAIAESGGMVGLNFATCFLDPAGQRAPETSLDTMLRHLDHLVGRLGVDHVGFGSDFDGATVPDVIGDVTGLPKLQFAMREHGYDDATLRKICHENWVDVLAKSWK
jgi:membrane dipeptidase